ncbi:MAG: hypothetical protein HKN76_20290 [Saprospiraceae bacterium]|nr:hypothetical protein [Saprospiraceae bacterium]
MKKVLITDDVHPSLIEGLRTRNYVVEYMPEISLSDTISIIDAYEGIVINSKIKAHQAFLSRADKLEFIARLGSGLEIIDLDMAAEKGIQVFSAPEGNCNAVAEHAVGMLLCLFNNLLQADSQVRQEIWQRERNRGRELGGLTVGIIGYGHTGPSFAAKLAGFDVNVLVYDRFKPISAANGISVCGDLTRIQNEADVISLHVSLNETSHHMINSEFIDACHKPFVLINTSRGKAVKLQDLLEGLKTGKVSGAGLDVFENEKPSTFTEEEKSLYSQLYRLKQVVLSPHIAGWTLESKKRIADVLLTKLDNSGLLKNI